MLRGRKGMKAYSRVPRPGLRDWELGSEIRVNAADQRRFSGIAGPSEALQSAHARVLM